SRLAAGLNDPTKDSKWLLRRVSGLFFAAGAHDGVPPGVRGELPLSGFLRSDEPPCHVRRSVDSLAVEVVLPGVLRVVQDIVVLCGPLLVGSSSVVIRPDNLGQERLSAEDGVE